jgi:hypothetical protein
MVSKTTAHNLTYELQDKYVNRSNNETTQIHAILDDDDYFPDEDCDEFGFHLPNNTTDCTSKILDDDVSAQHVDYSENYTVKMLSHIANYYDIPKKKTRKDELISMIVDYENNPEKSIQVYNRKRCWHYIQELQEDSYFGKFIIFN